MSQNDAVEKLLGAYRDMPAHLQNAALADAAEKQHQEQKQAERVVEVRYQDPDHWSVWDGVSDRPMNDCDIRQFVGTEILHEAGDVVPRGGSLTIRYTIRREPEPEKPKVRPWRTRPKDTTSRVIDICPECECAISVHVYDGRRCPKCHVPFGEHRDLPEATDAR